VHWKLAATGRPAGTLEPHRWSRRRQISYAALVSRSTSRLIITIRVAALALLALPALSGCANLYFESAGTPPEPPPKFSLDQLPWKEYWTGIVFNGEKIGFAHTRVKPAPQPGEFEIHSEAAFLLRFLGVEKKFRMKSVDQVDSNLALVRFDYDYDMDDIRQQVRGEVRHHTLRAEIHTRDNTTVQSLPVSGPVFPAGVIGLYPVRHGLAVGRGYRYNAYSGETQTISEVDQQIRAFERSELFDGPAFRIETTYEGQATTTWMNDTGLPVFELSLTGVMISALEDETRARSYLAAASLNKKDIILDFSRIPIDRTVKQPRESKSLNLEIASLDSRFLLPPTPQQRCTLERDRLRCALHRVVPGDHLAESTPAPQAAALGSSVAVPSDHPRIKSLARDIADGATNHTAQARAIVAWLQKNIAQEPNDVFSALDVLDTRKAECQGHTFLYAALARSLGIPTRVVNGIVYSDDYAGFYYHTWAESLLDDGWIAVDPTFGQIGADATHVKLIEGEAPADLLPLVDLVGRLRVKRLDN